jgi:protein-S-isoprenylcysteine O-methyltransferase Ste14
MLIILVIMVGFAVTHSWLAGQRVKDNIYKLVGERHYYGFYRIGYNVLAIVTLMPVFAVIFLYPHPILWHINGGVTLILFAIQGVGAAGIIVALLQTDIWRFAGIRQMQHYFERKPLPLANEPLCTDGLYQFVRHPLYLFSLLVIWSINPMTDALFVFNVAATIYLIVGSLLEERRLRTIFGQQYVAYQEQVPWLIPLVRVRR